MSRIPQSGYAAYRADIDGLRAVAILAVLAFHAFPNVAPSGFYGVDVFFVISGYLIGGIILRQLAERRFSFLNFYGRRVRRIFPALVVVLVATTVIGWVVLLPQEYAQLGLHVAAAAAFASNFLLWTEAGYFDSATEFKPLMHLWSLGVEEQFYILWPFLLILATRLLRKPLPIMALVAIASYGGMVVAAHGDPVAAFYLPFYRFWELMLGSILAAVGVYSFGSSFTSALPHRAKSYLREALALLGIALIVRAVTLPLPEWARSQAGSDAIVPTLGCALAIAAGPSTWTSRNILGNRVARAIGLISYPLYLWHWPLLSFGYIIHGPAILAEAGGTSDALPPFSWRIGAAAASVALATLTFFLVETPLRFGRNSGAKALALCVTMVVKDDLIVYDRLHLTIEGSKFVVKRILDQVLGAKK